MTLLERVSTQQRRPRGRKGFSEPPFWSLDSLRHALVSSPMPGREQIENDFAGYVDRLYKRSGPVFSCIRARQMIFAQAQFAWRHRRTREVDFSDQLDVLERPWVGGATADLLGRMEVDLSLAGNAYVTIVDDQGRYGQEATGPGRRMARLRPDWVTIVINSPSGDPFSLDARVVGYLYEPPGHLRTPRTVTAPSTLLTADQVCHYALHPDPVASWRGMSWITPVLEEVQADRGSTRHKRKFFENGAQLSTVVSFDKDIKPERFDHFVAKFNERHRGPDAAYETLFLGGGADAKVVTADMQQLDFKSLSGAAETRIASAAGVHPVVVGMSEGMQGAALNAGNFAQVKRLVSEGTLQHMWGDVAASLQTLLQPPTSEHRLFVDTRHIEFLRVDRRDVAEIMRTQAVAIRQLVEVGYEPDAAARMVAADDVTELEGQHSGLFSVQLHPPMAGDAAEGGDDDEQD